MKLIPKVLVAVVLLAGSVFAVSTTAVARSVSGGNGAAHPIDSVSVLDSRHLLVGAGCPSDTPIVTVQETHRAVRLRATYTATAFACLRVVKVTLASPIGHRRIIDMVTGETPPPSRF